MNTKDFLMKYGKKIIGKQLLVFLIVIVYVISCLFSPLLFSFLIDNIIDKQPITNGFFGWFANSFGGIDYLASNLWIGGLFLFLVNVIIGICLYTRGKLNNQISETMTENIRNDLYNHIQLMPYSYQVRVNTGDLIQRCTSDVDTIRRFFSGQIGEIFYVIIMSSIAGYIMFTINVKLALASISFLPIVFIVSLYFFKKVHALFTKYDEIESELTTITQENLSNLRVVRAFNREAYEMSKQDVKNHELSGIDFALIKLLGTNWGVSDFFTLVPILLVIILGIYEVVDGQLSIGEFSVFISYTSMVLNPIRQLARMISDMGKMKVSISRLNEIFNDPIEDVVSGKTFNPKGEIVFDHVSFQYADGNMPVLNDISFKVKHGETLAILGPTGSGKSTLVHLLTRLNDYTGGSITIGGVELKEIQKKTLRKNIGIVLQEPFLFSKTIYDNIRISNQEISKQKVYKAAKIASVHEVIRDFSEGYNTLVGEKGVTLSGGQKQRIAIARTIINNCPILIFDDSLSAVDTQTDNYIRKAIKALSSHCTTIIIAHRVSSVQDADHIIVLEEGKITQNGTHEQLLKQNGLYKRVYEIQTAIKESDSNE